MLLVNSLVLHSEHFSLHTKYKTAPDGLVIALWTALALPILIPSIFTALQMNSAFYETFIVRSLAHSCSRHRASEMSLEQGAIGQ